MKLRISRPRASRYLEVETSGGETASTDRAARDRAIAALLEEGLEALALEARGAEVDVRVELLGGRWDRSASLSFDRYEVLTPRGKTRAARNLLRSLRSRSSRVPTA